MVILRLASPMSMIGTGGKDGGQAPLGERTRTGRASRNHTDGAATRNVRRFRPSPSRTPDIARVFNSPRIKKTRHGILHAMKFPDDKLPKRSDQVFEVFLDGAPYRSAADIARAGLCW